MIFLKRYNCISIYQNLKEINKLVYQIVYHAIHNSGNNVP